RDGRGSARRRAPAGGGWARMSSKMPSKPRAWVSWSSGKDAAWALHVARAQGELEIAGLLTTVSETFDRVAMHGVRRELLMAQAEATGLPVDVVPLPYPCSNEEYEARMRTALDTARA